MASVLMPVAPEWWITLLQDNWELIVVSLVVGLLLGGPRR